MLDNSMSITETARFLQSLRTGHERVDELPPALMPPDLAAAYRAQTALVDGLCVHWGGTTAGYKVALTNPAAQRMLGVPYPVFGRLFTARLHESGVTLRCGRLRHPADRGGDRLPHWRLTYR